MKELKRYFSTKEAAAYLGLSKVTLTNYRSKGEGPVYIKIGRIIRYDVHEIENWVASYKEQAED